MSQTPPPDPLGPVHAWGPVYTAAPITSLPHELPGIWIGNGLEAARIEPMSQTSPAHLEQLLGEQGGYEVILREPDELPASLARQVMARIQGRGRLAYVEALTAYAALALPGVMQQVWDHDGEDLSAAEWRFAVSMWAHPVGACWPVQIDAWHAHCIVLGNVWHSGNH